MRMYLPLSLVFLYMDFYVCIRWYTAGSKTKCAPTSVGVIGALSYLAMLPLYFILHVYLDVYIVLYCGGGFWPPNLFCLDS